MLQQKIDLKLLVQKTLYDSFKKLQPDLVTEIEKIRDKQIPLSACINYIAKVSKECKAPDDGNNIILLAEYIYSQPHLN